MRGRISFRDTGSAAGTVIAGCGMFFLYQDLAGAAEKLVHVLGGNGADGLGMLPAVVLVAPYLSHAAGFMQQALLSCWPLLLVAVGTKLSRGIRRPEANNFPGEKAVGLSI
jgi:hypothetical protein